MKKIVSFLVSSFFISQAQSAILAKAQVTDFAHAAQNIRFLEVTLDSDRYITLKIADSKNPQEIIKTVSYRLNPIIFNELRERVISLSNAKIKQDFNAAVCEIYVHPAQYYDNLFINPNYDSQSASFHETDPVLVDSPHGCWVHHNTQPVNASRHEDAHILKEQLKIFALH